MSWLGTLRTVCGTVTWCGVWTVYSEGVSWLYGGRHMVDQSSEQNLVQLHGLCQHCRVVSEWLDNVLNHAQATHNTHIHIHIAI